MKKELFLALGYGMYRQSYHTCSTNLQTWHINGTWDGRNLEADSVDWFKNM